jgi:hypothetical protein
MKHTSLPKTYWFAAKNILVSSMFLAANQCFWQQTSMFLAANQYVFGSKPVCFWQTSMFHAVSSVVYGISKNTHNIHSQLYKTYKSWS